MLSELTAAIRLRTRCARACPQQPAAAVIRRRRPLPSIRPSPITAGNTARFSLYVAIGVAAVASITLSFIIFAGLGACSSRSSSGSGIHDVHRVSCRASGSTRLLAVAGAAITLKLGVAGIAFALAAVFAFSYMAHLVDQSRHRAQQYVSLSWGVLAGLMRSLDVRDQRAARHAAAVAGSHVTSRRRWA